MEDVRETETSPLPGPTTGAGLRRNTRVSLQLVGILSARLAPFLVCLILFTNKTRANSEARETVLLRARSRSPGKESPGKEARA